MPLRRSSGPGPVLPGKIRDLINAEFGGSLFSHDFGVYSIVFQLQSHYLLMHACMYVCMYIQLQGFLDFTTEVSVWPNTFPYEECSGEACGVRLV